MAFRRTTTTVRNAAEQEFDEEHPELAAEDFGSGIQPDPKKVAVLFDFDGTIGDTETPAMEVAYWELAPYFPAAAGERCSRAGLGECKGVA